MNINKQIQKLSLPNCFGNCGTNSCLDPKCTIPKNHEIFSQGVEEALGKGRIHMGENADGSYVIDEKKQKKYDSFREAFYEGLIEGCKAGGEEYY